MKLGAVYKPVDELSLYFDIHKDVLFKPIYRAGLEYLLVDRFYIRTGVNSEPFTSHFGGGVLLERFKIDYAFSNSDFLGASHQAGISFIFFKKDES